MPGTLGDREGFEESKGRVVVRFGLTTSAAVAEVLFDVLAHLEPVELSPNEFEGAGSSWVAW